MKRRSRRQFLYELGAGAAGWTLCVSCRGRDVGIDRRPNILWIVAEDASPYYGKEHVRTPHLDALGTEGVRFENAFVTSPVCSPSRSALITGMYPTTLGTTHHRSQVNAGKGGGNVLYYDSYRLPKSVSTIPDLFRRAGYYTSNGEGSTADRPGKTDYNFILDDELYDGADWKTCPAGRPFFAQIQLPGGKARPEASERLKKNVSLPPYYPEDPVLGEDWASYLASWEAMDEEVGKIIDALKAEGVYENTVIFFFTDHGVSHVRGKQFLYDEGIRIPMIVRLPGGRSEGTVDTSPVLHLDIAATSLALAGIPIPRYVDGRALFGEKGPSRGFIVCARDRCDETIDTIRCVRTKRYKYIRNFMSARPHTQPNQYKDGKTIMQRMRLLHEQGRLNALQDRIFDATRPSEELYDVVNDPYETANLADESMYRETLVELRNILYEWMEKTGDLGLIPEPILEDMGKEQGNKYRVSRRISQSGLIPRLIGCIEAGERGDVRALYESLSSEEPSERYWAAQWLGILKDEAAIDALKALADDAVPAVRIASKLALCRLGLADVYLPALIEEMDDPNLIAGMYAAAAVEQTGIVNDVVRRAAEHASDNPYEFIRRYGHRWQSLF